MQELFQQLITEYSVGQVKEQLTYGGFQLEKILSKPIARGSFLADLKRNILHKFISLMGSHHELESTVFYLARNTAGDA